MERGEERGEERGYVGGERRGDVGEVSRTKRKVEKESTDNGLC